MHTRLVGRYMKGSWAITTPDQTKNERLRELGREEGLELLYREARCYVHMSAEVFIQAWEAGQFNDDPAQPGVIYVAMLLTFADRSSLI
jgi:hypothetical protein